MALPTASDNQFPKVIMEEVANDGSATVTPAADHRAIFLGEDGQLHAKDSAAAVTNIGGAPTDIVDIPTAETDAALVLAPDGAGGVEFRAEGALTLTAPGTWAGTDCQNANTTLAANQAYYGRITIPFAWTPNRIGLTIQTSSGNIDLGIYADDGTGQNPGARIASLGSTASPGTGSRLFTIAPGALVAGVYWLAMAPNNGTISVGYAGIGSGNGQGGAERRLIQATAFPLPATAGAGLSAIPFIPSVWMEIV